MSITKPTIGRIVEVSLRDALRETVIQRPGIIVATDMGSPDGVNVQVFLDGKNDAGVSPEQRPVGASLWETSIRYNADGVIPDGQHATWRYPAKQVSQIEV